MFNGYPAILVRESSKSILQPILEEILNVLFNVFEEVNAFTHITSHAIVNSILTPLEMAQSRLAIQNPCILPEEQSNVLNTIYKWSFYSVFQSIVKNEGESDHTQYGLLYTSRIMIPSIILSTLKPTLSFFTTQFIEECLIGHQTGLTYHTLYFLCKTIFIGIETIVWTPFQLAQKRLFIQCMTTNRQKNHATPFETVMKTSGIWYSGIWHALTNVIKNECTPTDFQANHTNSKSYSTKPIYHHEVDKEDLDFILKRKSAKQKTWWKPQNNQLTKNNAESQSWKGFKSMYRGFWPRFTIEWINFLFEVLKQNKNDDII